jgi:hypothetical protein
MLREKPIGCRYSQHKLHTLLPTPEEIASLNSPGATIEAWMEGDTICLAIANSAFPYTMGREMTRRTPGFLDSCHPQPDGGTSLLDARAKAIDKVVKDCGGEASEAGPSPEIRGMLVMLVREAAGKGFDEGIRHATNPK